jgi:hypothetical protein
LQDKRRLKEKICVNLRPILIGVGIMTRQTELIRTKANWGDTAVDGLLAGVGGGIVMALYLGLAGLWLDEGFAIMLGRFDPSAAGSPVAGGLAHLAMAAIYGILFALSWRLLLRRWLGGVPLWLTGLAYGLLLFLFAWAVLLPGTDSPLQAIPAVHLVVAHLIYGLSLGWQTRTEHIRSVGRGQSLDSQ